MNSDDQSEVPENDPAFSHSAAEFKRRFHTLNHKQKMPLALTVTGDTLNLKRLINPRKEEASKCVKSLRKCLHAEELAANLFSRSFVLHCSRL